MANQVSWILSRLSKARDLVRAVLDTLSYLGEARVHPPLPSLPAAKDSK
jgi:hypothetical protein